MILASCPTDFLKDKTFTEYTYNGLNNYKDCKIFFSNLTKTISVDSIIFANINANIETNNAFLTFYTLNNETITFKCNNSRDCRPVKTSYGMYQLLLYAGFNIDFHSILIRSTELWLSK